MVVEPIRLCEQLYWGELTIKEQLRACQMCPARLLCRQETLEEDSQKALKNIKGVRGGLATGDRVRLQHRSPGKKATETRCKWGHLWTTENTEHTMMKSGNTYRVCRTCRRKRQRKYESKSRGRNRR